jgi:hypothetical protein
MDTLGKKDVLRSVVKDGPDDVRGVRATVWISDDGLVRRRRVTTTVGASVAAGRGSRWAIEMTLELFDFGMPMHIELPPADQVHRVGPSPK